MKKVMKLVLALVLMLTTLVPFSVSAQDVTPDEALLGVITSLKDMKSFKGDFNGAMNMEYTEGTADFTTDGAIQVKIAPALEFGFDFNMAMDAIESDGATTNETFQGSYYLVDQTLYTYQDDSADDTDGEWVTQDAADMMGMTPEQVTQQYQMLISMLEGAVRSYYIPSTVNQLIGEKTTIESSADGYKITINSFETEEEWLAFFTAIEELEQSTTQEAAEATGVELDSDLDDLQEQAKALSAGLTYTITVETDANFFINSINVIVDTNVEALDTAEADEDTPQSVQATFNYTVTDRDFEESVELPAEAQGL